VTVDAAHYIGNELELFAAATHWKSYFARSIAPYILGDVLEVGAGIGSNTLLLHNEAVRSWQSLEPDSALARTAVEAVAKLTNCRVIVGTTSSPELGRYDTILYVDVLEHIDDDTGELVRAASLLRPGGNLVVLAPAHQALYSAFDKAIGHFRRYNATTLSAVGPAELTLERTFYLDSVGMLASFANRALLKRSQPGKAQIATWDRFMVPLSTFLDPVFGRKLGKSVVAVWSRPKR
jgi:protein-L-isoaspartate O-methyltransferase